MAVFCRNCGKTLNDDARFCSACGAQMNSAPFSPGYGTQTQLARPRMGRMIAGVCQGLANQYRWDVAWVRVLAVVSLIFGGGVGGVVYLVLWVVMPEEPYLLPASPYGPPSGS
jgi:phage shock protein C